MDATQKIIAKLPVKVGHPRHLSRALLVSLFCLLPLIIIAVGLAWFYHGRALPNVSVGGTSVGNMTSEEIRQAIIQLPTPNVTFVDEADRQTVPLSKLGVTVDVDTTLRDVLRARRRGDWLTNVMLWQTKEVPLVFTNDPGKLKLYLQTHYPSIFVDPKDASLVYNADDNHFKIKPGTDGRGVNLRSFESSLPELALHPHDLSLWVEPGPVAPLITEAGMKQAQKAANKRVRLDIRFMLDNKEVYKAGKDAIANWIHVIPDVVKGTAHIEFDQAKIKQYITDVVSPSIAAAPIDRKVVIDKQSGAKNVISPGKDGHAIKDADEVANNILHAVTKGQAIDQPITVSTAHYKTVTMKGYGKWIEVDLTNQTTTLYLGDKPIETYLISSGRAQTPTEVGEFAVYRKYPVKTMTGTILGEYYYVPNIKWVSFFDGGEAFHGTYWHHNFGHPMSHGCINMTEAAAKVLYDFAPIGTKVIVHY